MTNDSTTVEIIDYEPALGIHFKRINYAWIGQLFEVEAEDIESLEHHQEKILDGGGAILFARVGEDIVGTCALIKWSDELYELAKMGVDPEFQGRQIGKQLGLAVIDRARRMGATKLFLDSNRKLAPALKLYEQLGFREIPYDDRSCNYMRCDIRMELDLQD